MTIESIIAGKIISRIVDKTLSYLSSASVESNADRNFIAGDVEVGLKNQINKAINFSRSLETFRHEDNRDIVESTIGLTISNSTRQSFQALDDSVPITEQQLLSKEQSQLILGDPGSGKTTTLKRLISESFRLIFEEEDEKYHYSLPVFFKFAEIPPTESFFTYFAKSIGISYETIAREVEYDVTEWQKIRAPKGEYVDEVTETRTKTIYEYKIGNLSLDVAITEWVNDQNIIIFLDGMDELHYKIREKVFSEIKTLLSSLTTSKVIITSRYFEDVDGFKNINKNEILPLTKDETLSIVSQWISESDKFWSALSEKPYTELSTRPLFLFYLVMLYKANRGILPDQGVDVYRQIVLLVLREWDDQKEFRAFRYSKIKDFDTYKKEEFIGHMSFYLTYELGVKKIFSHSDLNKAYTNICNKHPPLQFNDAESVIKDIETDNALIITSYANEYEFSHLSLQEYLCARHILSIPFSRKIYDYLTRNPEPLALAVILSSDPSGWFAMLVLNNINEQQHNRKLTPSVIYLFINRLITEGAQFDEGNVEFGMAIFLIIFLGGEHKRVEHVISKFIEKEKVLMSCKLAKSKFKVSRKGKGTIEITRKSDVHSDLYLDFPSKGTVPIGLWNKITM